MEGGGVVALHEGERGVGPGGVVAAPHGGGVASFGVDPFQGVAGGVRFVRHRLEERRFLLVRPFVAAGVVGGVAGGVDRVQGGVDASVTVRAARLDRRIVPASRVSAGRDAVRVRLRVVQGVDQGIQRFVEHRFLHRSGVARCGAASIADALLDHAGRGVRKGSSGGRALVKRFTFGACEWIHEGGALVNGFTRSL